ncbi:MAG: hypothetical protein IPG99_22325 [Ignavibacteria bacterium]|nr:hypothetical protein [Ignavibacteria bacterium]
MTNNATTDLNIVFCGKSRAVSPNIPIPLSDLSTVMFWYLLLLFACVAPARVDCRTPCENPGADPLPPRRILAPMIVLF